MWGTTVHGDRIGKDHSDPGDGLFSFGSVATHTGNGEVLQACDSPGEVSSFSF